MQQQPPREGGGGSQGYGGYPQTQAAATAGDEQHQRLGDLGIAEAASPISSRPPAAPNFDELMRATAEAAGGSGGVSGNRWPRQETMALLRIRSEMDAAFRDTTPKGPLWEQVSRKLVELGYHRNAKKCKEKFENVHKYYKRTKEGRTGRQDGKSYKFFTELEALHHSTTTATSSGNPINVLPTNPNPAPAPVFSMPPPVSQPQVQILQAAPPPTVPLRGNIGISFSSDNSSSSEGEDDDEDEEMEIETPDTVQHQRKRKRGHDSDQGMMEFFEGLIKQVMQKQEVMQYKFLEAIEKREQDRMIREEAWKRQDMARLAREHELMAQERSTSASRDAAIIDFLQKITGQTIQLPAYTVPINPQPPTLAPPPPPSVQQNQPTFQQPQSQNYQRQQQEIPSHSNKQPQTQSVETTRTQQPTNTSGIIAGIPEQQIVPYQDMTSGGSLEGTSSRWPKPEVLALIQIRSGMESKYQEAGPKGPLWEEISASMKQMGYSRNAKRCKEKWENINKYFKKVKESKKKRPEDAKTCPYYHELDALYQKKVIGSTGGPSGSGVPVMWPAQQQQEPLQVNESVDKYAGGETDVQTSNAGAFPSYLFGEQNQSAPADANQPEDSVSEQLQQSHGNMIDNLCNNVRDSNSENLDHENGEYYEEVDDNEEYDDDDDDDDTEEDMKMEYKIQFQGQKVGSSDGGGQASASCFGMVQ